MSLCKRILYFIGFGLFITVILSPLVGLFGVFIGSVIALFIIAFLIEECDN